MQYLETPYTDNSGDFYFLYFCFEVNRKYIFSVKLDKNVNIE